MIKKTRFVYLAAITVIVLAAVLTCSASPAAAAGDYSDVDSYIRAAMQAYNIPGAALVVAQDGEILFGQGYGNAAPNRLVTGDTPFYIGSQSKSFTAMAIMQLVEQGLIDLAAPVQTYLPWFRVADEQASGQITIRNLLQHTSGLSEEGYVENFPPDASLETIVRDLSRARLTAPVGTEMQYFNPGYSTLGLIIETVSGQSYGAYLQEHVFQPLGMVNSFTDPVEAQAAGLAQGYAQVFMTALPFDQTFYQYNLPAGFIMSSANDMARYMMALANGGELDGVRVLQPESVEQLFTPNTAIGSNYGFGWYISEYYGQTQITHGGDTERFHTSVLILPDNGLTVVMLFNENHLIKDLTDYNTFFWSVVGLLTGHPLPQAGTSSILYGWGMFIAWLVILALTVRNLINLPKWRIKMLTWKKSRRWTDIGSHVLGIAVSVAAVVYVVPAFLQRGFNWVWFIGFLPDVAIVVGTLILMDAIQMVAKIWLVARNR
jgi:CubicO group peptidase (beta-lactamase class C family)